MTREDAVEIVLRGPRVECPECPECKGAGCPGVVTCCGGQVFDVHYDAACHLLGMPTMSERMDNLLAMFKAQGLLKDR